MNLSENSLVSSLSERYADSMCHGNPDRTFSRSEIAAAYIIGSLTATQRVKSIILAASQCPDGPSPDIADRLLAAINDIESRPQTT